MDDLMRRLREAGSTGLDLSPGDPLCMEAYKKIKQLRTATENLVIAVGMGWDLDGVVGQMKAAFDKEHHE